MNDFIKVAYKVYTSKKHKKDKKDLEGVLDQLADKNDTNLSGMPVLVDKAQPFRNFMRYYVPRTARQIPQKIGHGLLTAAGGIGLVDALIQSTYGKGDYYMGGINTVNVTTEKPSIMAHEVGHWADFERGKRHLKHDYTWPEENNRYFEPLTSEINASVFALKAAKSPTEKKQWIKKLGPAFSTYLIAQWLPPATWREYDKVVGWKVKKTRGGNKGKPTKKFPMSSMASRVKTGKSPEDRSRAAMLILAHLHETIDLTKYIKNIGKGEMEEWFQYIPKKYADLAKRVLLSETKAALADAKRKAKEKQLKGLSKVRI
jgi:hypothetical protein